MKTSTSKTSITSTRTKQSKYSKKTSSLNNSINKSKTRINKDAISKNVYREHQEDVIKNYADNKGVLLYHSVGSGKTITALGIYKQLVKIKKDLKLIIICEPYIKYRWMSDISFLNINQKNVNYYTYTSPKLEKINLKQSIIIIDEAHNIVPLMQDKRNYNIIKNILTCYKIISLTATPIRRNISDISYLLNFTARKNILPYNPDEFRHKFMLMNRAKQAIFGNIYPYISSIIPYLITTKYNNEIIAHALAPGLSMIILLSLTMLSFESFFKLDAEKVSKYIKPYISFYSVNEDNKYYPKINSVYHNYAYNIEHYNLIMDYSTHKFNPFLLNILKDIQKSESIKNNKGIIDPKEIINIYANYSDPDRYLDNLTVIGNVGNSSKITGIIDFIEKHSKSKHVVYSKFKNLGIDIMKKELKKRNIKFQTLSKELSLDKFNKLIQDFKTNDISVLLLDPKNTEGFELYGIRHFHLMEPINDYTLLTQIKGRAYRYNSHKHLPESERTLTYHTWYCYLPEYKKILYQMIIYKKIFGFIKDNLLAPFYIPRRIPYTISPDEICINNIKTMEDNLIDINNQFIK